MKALSMFSCLIFLIPYSFPQCNVGRLPGRADQNLYAFTLTSNTLDDNFLNQAGSRWANACGTSIPQLSTSQGQNHVVITVEVVDSPGTNHFAGFRDTQGQLTHGTVTLFTSRFLSSGHQVFYDEDEMSDSLTHELGHALGLNNGSCGMMGPPVIVGDDFLPRTIEPGECHTAESIWTPEEDSGCDPTYICMQKGHLDFCCDNHSPLIIDFDQNGFQFSGLNQTVVFDLYGSGEPISITWVLPRTQDLFLFQDINGNGICDDGSELFGSGTRLILEGSKLALNGFEALAQYDLPELGGNSDHFITAEDELWSSLFLWQDWNANGICEESEIWNLTEVQLTKLEIHAQQLELFDVHGNKLKYWAKAYSDFEGLSVEYDLVDVFFRALNP